MLARATLQERLPSSLGFLRRVLVRRVLVRRRLLGYRVVLTLVGTVWLSFQLWPFLRLSGPQSIRKLP
jgi:hypothetical protein